MHRRKRGWMVVVVDRVAVVVVVPREGWWNFQTRFPLKVVRRADGKKGGGES